ncbi:glycoside hydrolase family 18 protein [Collybiopsis luxurians FD-317 M1]|nr:glycoside hydrolase family 18 protein [Collybiopsis luxurians FD-317 M1]
MMVLSLSSALSILSLTNFISLATAARPDPSEPLHISSAWLAGWHTSSGDPKPTPAFDLSNISWSKYTDIYYSFAVLEIEGLNDRIPTDNTSLISLNGSAGDVLPSFVQQAHANGVNAHIALGGWGGSQFFSTSVGSAENRTLFVKALTDFATNYSLDGINFDWEYPNKQGIGCNVVNESDTANFLAFLQELREDPVGNDLILSAATAITPFVDSDGTASTNVSAFAEVFDYINIMVYDIWGSWSASVGPNAPLNDTCASPDNQQGSAVSAVSAWFSARMPLEKIVLGVPSYGHSFSVNKTSAFQSGSTTQLAAYPAFNNSDFPFGDSWDNAATVPDSCGLLENNGGTYDFWSLIELGYLTAQGNFTDAYPHRFDDCSQTVYVYDEQKELMISFDNAESFASKGAFIKDYGLAGFAMWEAGGDSNDILLDAIRAAAGFEDEDC